MAHHCRPQHHNCFPFRKTYILVPDTTTVTPVQTEYVQDNLPLTYVSARLHTFSKVPPHGRHNGTYRLLHRAERGIFVVPVAKQLPRYRTLGKRGVDLVRRHRLCLVELSEVLLDNIVDRSRSSSS